MSTDTTTPDPYPDFDPDTGLPVALDASYCPDDPGDVRPYPPSYLAAHRRNPDECVAEDPCLPDGTTLWNIAPCTPTTTTAVAVGEPPAQTLPATGGTALVLLGAILATTIGVAVRKAVS